MTERPNTSDTTRNAASSAPPDASAKLQKELQQEITAHQKKDHSRSYLGRVSNLFYKSDERSLHELTLMQADIDKHRSSGDNKYAEQKQEAVEKEIAVDKSNLTRKDLIAGGIETALTVAPLFIPGPVGMAASAVMNGLDEANPSDSAGVQLEEFALGAVKGVVKKTLTGKLFNLPVAAPIRGVLQGESMRATQTLFDNHTYVSADGALDARAAGINLLKNVVEPAVNPAVIATDAMAFGGSSTLSREAGNVVQDALHTVAASAVKGAVTGFVIGSVNEASRELRTDSKFSAVDVAESGAKLGGMISTAAAIGTTIKELPLYNLSVPYQAPVQLSAAEATK